MSMELLSLEMMLVTSRHWAISFVKKSAVRLLDATSTHGTYLLITAIWNLQTLQEFQMDSRSVGPRCALWKNCQVNTNVKLMAKHIFWCLNSNFLASCPLQKGVFDLFPTNVTMCEDQRILLSCPNGSQIKIHVALYGKWQNNHLCGFVYNFTHCAPHTTTLDFAKNM